MLHRVFALTAALTALLPVYADIIEINSVEHLGPVPVKQYAAIGETSAIKDVDPLAFEWAAANADFRRTAIDSVATDSLPQNALHIVAFNIENRRFAPVTVRVAGLDDFKVTIDGADASAETNLHPGTHRAEIKYLSKYTTPCGFSIKLEADPRCVQTVDGPSRMITLDDVMYGKRIASGEMSPKGNYFVVTYYDVDPAPATRYSRRLYDGRTLKPVSTLDDFAGWMPRSEKYYVVRRDYEHARHIVTVDPATGAEEILADHLPDGHFLISPTEDFLIFSVVREGPKENPKIYRVIEPEDRQPGWRDRMHLSLLPIGKKEPLQPIAMGNNDVECLSISDDGRRMLLRSSSRAITSRPSTVHTLLSLDLADLSIDTIAADDGFISSAYFSPDASAVVVTASPEAFGRIGCTLPDDVVPSMYDYQLYIIDTATKDIKPMTRDFKPSLLSSQWSRYNGKIYMRTTDRDNYTIYTLDPKTGEIKLVPTDDGTVRGFSLADSSPSMLVWGQSDSNPDRIFCHDARNNKSRLIDAPSQKRLENVRLARVHDFNYITSRGDSIYARYYLPDNFDPQKKYPMIVNYYGGCNPSTRFFESRYPMHVYASLGYVMLQITPSGATGYGQEWSSRHVSTAGEGVAQDIIEGTKLFCEQHPFVDEGKIGCIGASYGGFMTQYLQTVTDIFAAAVSHAGISDHTSYWGEGYWGYSYSEVSMGYHKPWTNPDLYVKQSPLFRADKIKTPILFLHGDSDTNVPVGESIQMFTALKLLGVETALVQVAGENHHILDFEKRKKWQDTIFAWFAKYLQDDDSWWEDLYPSKNL